jgi:hypothetical protein
MSPAPIRLERAVITPLHGHQEGRFFHGYYHCYCYLPLYIFSGPHLLAAKLRRADIDAAAGAVERASNFALVRPGSQFATDSALEGGGFEPAGHDTEAENAERDRHSDRNRRQSAAAAHGGVQDRADEKQRADRLEHERTAVGDALRGDR